MVEHKIVHYSYGFSWREPDMAKCSCGAVLYGPDYSCSKESAENKVPEDK